MGLLACCEFGSFFRALSQRYTVIVYTSQPSGRVKEKQREGRIVMTQIQSEDTDKYHGAQHFLLSVNREKSP